MDFKPNGSLCHIFMVMFRHKHDQRTRKLDFTVAKNRKDPNSQMLLDIEHALIEAECLRFPVVYVRSDVEKSMATKIKEIIRNHQGDLAEDEEEATHVIYPHSDPAPEDFARPVFKKDKHVLMHWYYFPESYDSWMPINGIDLPENVPDNLPPSVDRWRVTASWVLDLDQYNEWMPETDYEVDENGKKLVHSMRLSVDDLMSSGSDERTKNKGTKQKRKRSPSPTAKASGKRKA